MQINGDVRKVLIIQHVLLYVNSKLIFNSEIK